MNSLSCPLTLVDDTLKELRAAGRRRSERVVLWLSPRPLGTAPVIAEIYVPEQRTALDYFHIPPSGMKALMGYLAAHKLALAAQVHSHPARAFHSKADDEWAIVRHQGALSIVVPDFAAGTDTENFLSAAAVFRLGADDLWLEVGRESLGERLRLA